MVGPLSFHPAELPPTRKLVLMTLVGVGLAAPTSRFYRALLEPFAGLIGPRKVQNFGIPEVDGMVKKSRFERESLGSS